MSRPARKPQGPIHSSLLSQFQHTLSNFFFAGGLRASSLRTHASQTQAMPTAPPRHWTFFSMPRDHIHRRRFRRRVTNLVLIPLLSAFAAYVITRPTGGTGFTLPKGAQQARASKPRPLNYESETPAGAYVDGSFKGALAIPGPPHLTPAAETSPVASAVNPIFAGGYMLARGPYNISKVEDYVLRDAKRERTLHLQVFYPDEPGPYPVIVFAPGEGDSPSSCDALTRHWASYGYVILQPSYGNQASTRRNISEANRDSRKGVRETLNEPKLKQSRPSDIRFVLDSLAALQNHIPSLAGKIDEDHIGVGGQSLGAYSAAAIAGALVNQPGDLGTDLADPRVKAVVLLSPPGLGELGLTSNSLYHVKLPLLSIMGAPAAGPDEESRDREETPLAGAQSGEKYQMFIQGADRGSSLLSKKNSRGQSFLSYANSASLAFWDAYLKADPKAKIYLQSEALPDFSRGVVRMIRR